MFGGKVKNTGPVAERRSRLQGLLDKAIWCEQIAPEGSGQKHKYGSRYTVPHSNGQPVVVCQNFFAAVHGYDKGHSQWRKCKYQAEQNALHRRAVDLGLAPAAAAPPPPAAAAHASRPDDGHRARMTLDWFAQFVRNYAQPLPMRKELRFDFGCASSLYDWLRSELEVQLPKPQVDEMLIKKRRFQQLLASPDLLKQPAIKAAMKAKLAYHSAHDLDVSDWKLTWMDPSKKRDFSLCKCCGLVKQLQMKAVKLGDPALHAQANRYLNHHLTIARMRRDKFVENQQDAMSNPAQVITMIADAMDHKKLDGPVLHRAVRWTKAAKEETFAPCHLIGAMTWGHCDEAKPGRPRTWLYWHDALIGGEGTGINGTCEVIMKTLEALHAADQLPSDPNRRVLNLQCDNCRDNKNWGVLVQCALLVYAGTFTEVNLDFLPVGHTHEVIDQVFAVISDWLRKTDVDVSTFDLLQQQVAEMLDAHHTEELHALRDFKEAAQDVAFGKLHGHTKPYSFKFQVGEDGDVHMAFQTNGRPDAAWSSGPLMLEQPMLAADLDVHTLQPYEATKMMKAKDGEDPVDKFDKSLERLEALIMKVNDRDLPSLSEAAAAF